LNTDLNLQIISDPTGNNPQYEYNMNGVKLGKTEEKKDVGIWITKI
jgi:hypothetical protein